MPNIPVDKTDTLISTRMYHLDAFILICARFSVSTVYIICTAHLRKHTQIQTKHMLHSKTIPTLVIRHTLYILDENHLWIRLNVQMTKQQDGKLSNLFFIAYEHDQICGFVTNTQASKKTDHTKSASKKTCYKSLFSWMSHLGELENLF